MTCTGLGFGNRALSLLCMPSLWLFLYPPLAQASAERLQPLHGYVPSVVSTLKPVGRLDESTPVDLVIGLPLRNVDALTKLLDDMYDPSASAYQQYLTPRQYTERFCPSKSSYDALLRFANGNGLKIVNSPPNRKFVHVRAPAGVINRVFHITLQQYHHPSEDRLFYAPDVEPTIALGIPVSQITGLDNFRVPRQFHHELRKLANPKDAPNASGTGSGGAYTGRDFRAAYAPGVTLTGSTQAVGVLEVHGYQKSDIAAYETANGLPNVALQNVYLDGYTGTASPEEPNLESATDIELIISMAPGIPRVIVYGVRYSSAGIHDLLNEMANPTHWEVRPNQISTSYFFFYDKNVYDALAQLKAQGQALFVASGDWGSYDETSGKGTGAFAPADHPSVTSVGGTELQTTATGAWSSETAWGSSGGGYSPWGADPQFALPKWQSGMDFTLSQGSTTTRNAPDVAMVADNIASYFDGSWQFFAGTSAAAPLWAGFMALVNEQAADYGRPPIGFANPALYGIGRGGAYATGIHDITVGNNFNAINPHQYSAVTGFDLVTGWGSPNGYGLISALVRPTVCQQNPNFCYAIYDPWWWLKCPACGINVYINPGDNFRAVEVLDSLGREVGRFQHLQKPLVENGVAYDYRVSLTPKKGMGYVFRAEPAPGQETRGSFKPAYLVKSLKKVWTGETTEATK